jgi:hypothetical protein
LLTEKLTIIVRGAKLTSSEGEKTEPRDILFELETGALLKSWGLPVQLGQSADLRFEFKGLPVYANASASRHLRHSPKTCRLLTVNFEAQNEPECQHNALGMISLDVSRIVHLDLEGGERYPPVIYGDFLVPSNMVAVLNEVQFGGIVRQRLNSFVDLHQQAFRREFSPRVGGFMLCYNVPAVDLSGTGRTFVLSYPQIGSLKPATAAESKYFEGFHADMLNNYRRRPL